MGSAGICVSCYSSVDHYSNSLWSGSAITFPIESFSLKWFANVFALKSFRRSFITSLEVAFMATFISLLVGIPAAYALARSGMKGRGL